MKSQKELMKELESKQEKELENIINATPNKERKTAKVATSVILDEKTKIEFQKVTKEAGLNMGVIINALVKSYLKNPEVRKAALREISAKLESVTTEQLDK